MPLGDLDPNKVVVLDKTRNPALHRLGFTVMGSGEDYANYLQRKHVSVVLIHFSSISPEDCLYINEINQLFRGSLLYFGIEGDEGPEQDADVRALIGPDLTFEKIFPKTHTKPQIDHQIRLFQRRSTLANTKTLRPRPNRPPDGAPSQPPRLEEDILAFEGLSSQLPALKTTHIIFLCLVLSGALTLAYIAHLILSPPSAPATLAAPTPGPAPNSRPIPSTTKGGIATVPNSRVSTREPRAPTTRTGPAPSSQPEVVTPNRDRVANGLPRLPPQGTTTPASSASRENGILAKPEIDHRSQRQQEQLTQAPTGAAETTAPMAVEAPPANRTKTDTSSTKTIANNSANTLTDNTERNDAPVMNGTQADASTLASKEADAPAVTALETRTQKPEALPKTEAPRVAMRSPAPVPSTAPSTSTATPAKPIPEPSTKSSPPKPAVSAKPTPEPEAKVPATRKPAPPTEPPVRAVAILTPAQEQKVSQFNALAITQIQQKVYLPASRKSALFYFNEMYQLSGPSRTVKALANNITGNILKDATEAIQQRNTLELERAVDNLRAVERHIRGLSPDIHNRVSYQRLLSRYHRTLTRSEPILSQEMSPADKQNFRRALQNLRTLLKDLCDDCTDLA